MGIFKDFLGILGSTFQIGGTAGAKIKNSSAKIQLRNAADDAFTVGQALPIQSSNTVNDITTLLDLMAHFPLVEFYFAGATVPAAGTNTGKFGICHTTGGSYTIGDIIYDDGAALTVIPNIVVRGIMTDGSGTSGGTLELIANGIYVGAAGTWVLKGDGASSSTGVSKIAKVTVAYSDTTVDGSTSIPQNAVVNRTICDVTTLFNGTAPTLALSVNGSTPLAVMTTAENNAKLVNQYEVEDLKIVGANNVGVLRATVTSDSSTTGAATFYVFYVVPLT
jgi:hypothetical protein